MSPTHDAPTNDYVAPARTAVPADDAAVVGLEHVLATIVRQTNLPRLQDRLRASAGVRVNRAAYPVLNRIAQGEGVGVGELALELGVEPSTASRHASTLVEGWCREDVETLGTLLGCLAERMIEYGEGR